jgi:hypothetical protein
MRRQQAQWQARKKATGRQVLCWPAIQSGTRCCGTLMGAQEETSQLDRGSCWKWQKSDVARKSGMSLKMDRWRNNARHGKFCGFGYGLHGRRADVEGRPGTVVSGRRCTASKHRGCQRGRSIKDSARLHDQHGPDWRLPLTSVTAPLEMLVIQKATLTLDSVD